jgi:uncharacterized Zn finger protein
MEINVSPGHVSARVQGSRRRPYKVSIKLQPLSEQRWAKVLDGLAERAIFAAQLLNGEMPPDIERVFETLEVPLFPASRGDLKTHCSCPDWANPCKHIAAVYYLLGERFDEDPFLLFELRGRDKEEIAAELRERRGQAAQGIAEVVETAEVLEVLQAPALEDCLDSYWALGPEVEKLVFDIADPEVGMALLKRLGVPDFLEDARGFAAQMGRVYDGVTGRALDAAFTDVGE